MNFNAKVHHELAVVQRHFGLHAWSDTCRVSGAVGTLSQEEFSVYL